MKLAVLLPEGYDLALLRKANGLARAAQAGLNLRGISPDIAFGLPQGQEKKWRRDETALLAGVERAVVRHVLWERMQTDNARRMCPWNRRHAPEGLATLTIARDWGTNFIDCDLWFVLAEPAMGGVFTHRPTANFCAGLDMRRYPASFGGFQADPRWTAMAEAFQLWRSDEVTVAGDALTARDLVSFAGLGPDKVMTLPGLVPAPDFGALPALLRQPGRLVWRAGPHAGHDYDNAGEGLRLYRDEGGSLDVRIVTESDIAAFREGSNVPAIALQPPALRDMLFELSAERVVDDSGLARQLAQATCLWTSRVADGEGNAVLEALAAGLPVLAADTRHHRALAEQAQGAVMLYSKGSAVAVADALHALEARCAAQTLPAVPAPPQPAPMLVAQNVGFVIDRLLEHGDD